MPKSRFGAALLVLLTACTGAPPAPGSASRRILSNDNRTPGGQLVNGVLELKLELTSGVLYPHEDVGQGYLVRSFAEEGKAPTNPGPLIRVREGTELHISVRNTLKNDVKVTGLEAHPSLNSKNQLAVAPGETKDVRFRAEAAGTYMYFAESSDPRQEGADQEMAGVFVVDAPNDPGDDRLFAINIVEAMPDVFHSWVGNFLINGKAWPHTERLTYRVGEHARWRLINLSPFPHPFHMHGSYFTVTAVGTEDGENVFSDQEKRSVVTEPLQPGGSFRMDWVPERTGRWVFHCHLISHFAEDEIPQISYPKSSGSEAMARTAPANRHEAHTDSMTSAGMGGLVLGITALPGAAAAKAPDMPSSVPARQIDLVVSKRSQPSADGATLGYTLQEGGRDLPSFATMASPPIVLTQHQPVDVRIINRLQAPTAVHWHGIELDSYYDGVAGVGGEGRQITPAVAPGGSFVARFAPPRAGTFIYHTHWHDIDQLLGGLYGPLIVMPPGQQFDPETDKIVLITSNGPGDYDPLLVNSTRQPSQMTLKVGTKYRFRLIDIAANNLRPALVSLQDEKGPVMWRAIAKDGADLPASQQQTKPATATLMVGETFDFEFVPARTGRLTLDVSQRKDPLHVVTVIDVR